VANSRSPETLADLANATGATAVWAKDAATDAKDKVADAAATGADAVKTEVNKRTTRSSGSAE
jgi:hypothetical protein